MTTSTYRELFVMLIIIFDVFLSITFINAMVHEDTTRYACIIMKTIFIFVKVNKSKLM